VQTAQLTRAYGVIDQVMASNQRDSDRLRGAVVIDAAPALGKTTIATRYARDLHRKLLRRHGPRTPEGHQRLPVVYLPLSAGTTLKGLNQKLLRFYGHPAATKATRAELGALAVDCVQSCHTQLIIVDDLHFIDFKHRHGHEVSNHLKGLANEMPVTFCYVGVRLREKKFFDEGLLGEDAAFAQTSRRATRCEVAPFTLTTPAAARAWTSLLAALEAHVLLAESRPGMLTDHAKALHRRTQGCIGSLTNLLDRVCYLAIATGAETNTRAAGQHCHHRDLEATGYDPSRTAIRFGEHGREPQPDEGAQNAGRGDSHRWPYRSKHAGRGEGRAGNDHDPRGPEPVRCLGPHQTTRDAADPHRAIDHSNHGWDTENSEQRVHGRLGGSKDKPDSGSGQKCGQDEQGRPPASAGVERRLASNPSDSPVNAASRSDAQRHKPDEPQVNEKSGYRQADQRCARPDRHEQQ